MYDYGKTMMQDHIEKVAKKQEEFIMKRLEKQPGFISLEKSKHLIEVNKMYKLDEYVGTDYLFNGKRFLTIYPFEYSTEIANGNSLFATYQMNYREY